MSSTTLAMVSIILSGLTLALMAWNQKTESNRKRDALLNRLERSGKVGRW